MPPIDPRPLTTPAAPGHLPRPVHIPASRIYTSHVPPLQYVVYITMRTRYRALARS
jgi:hypothetical protein